VTPAPQEVRYPPLLSDSPAPQLKAYPKETVIAEKLEAIVSLGMANSRMKDYFDLLILLSEKSLDHVLVKKAIGRTFERRRTTIPLGLPIGLAEEFGVDKDKIAQWKAFLVKNRLAAPELSSVVATIREYYERIITL
jgi:predicted nucleotidyltransferase component of viral defense system